MLAAQSWLDAIGTPDEAQAAKKLIAELEEDVEPIDDLIAFGKSDRCAQIFGAEGAAGLLAHAQGAEGRRGEILRLPGLRRGRRYP